VDRTVADMNITHFKKLLAAEMDPVKRQTIECLLAYEKAQASAGASRQGGSTERTLAILP
jgi:hypothetical protein